MSREPLIFKITLPMNTTYQDRDELMYQLKENRYMIDGYDLVFFSNYSQDYGGDIECLYPIFKGDEEILKLQKENMIILNNLLKDKLNPSENISIIRKIIRKLKLNRIINIC